MCVCVCVCVSVGYCYIMYDMQGLIDEWMGGWNMALKARNFGTSMEKY